MSSLKLQWNKKYQTNEKLREKNKENPHHVQCMHTKIVWMLFYPLCKFTHNFNAGVSDSYMTA